MSWGVWARASGRTWSRLAALASLVRVGVSEGLGGGATVFAAVELKAKAADLGEGATDTAVPLGSTASVALAGASDTVMSARPPLLSRATVLRSLPPRQVRICLPEDLREVREDAFEVDDSGTEFTSSD